MKTITDRVEKRFRELQWAENNSQIRDLKRNVAFEIVPACKHIDGTATFARKYVADFTYVKNGFLYAEDVTSHRKAENYRFFSLQKALVLWIYGVEILEV